MVSATAAARPTWRPLPAVNEIETHGGEYFAYIDGLRAIAILSVLLGHAGLLPPSSGCTGVDVFFVISGFLISGIILRAQERQCFSYVDFYARRAKRIFPALILVLVGVWILGWWLLLPSEYRHLAQSVLSGSLFLQDFSAYSESVVGGVPDFSKHSLIHLWSLGVEEQFYLLWPIALAILWKTKHSFVVLLSICVLSFVLHIAAFRSSILAAYYLPWNRLWELAVGGLLAYARARPLFDDNLRCAGFPAKRLNVSGRWSSHIYGAIGFAMVFWSGYALRFPAFPGWTALIPTTGAALIIAAGPHCFMNKYVLSFRPIRFVGLISYPLYLWHNPLLVFGNILEWRWASSPTTTAIALSMAFLLSIGTYQFVERPVRSSPHVRPIAAGLVVILACCSVLGYLSVIGGVPARRHSADIEKMAAAASESDNASTRANASGFSYFGSRPHQVLFVGDSTVSQYSDRIAKLVQDHPGSSRSAVFALGSDCPSGILHIGAQSAACQRFFTDVIGYEHDSKVEIVVVAACWYCRLVNYGLNDHFGTPGPLNPQTDVALAELGKTIASFVRNGKQVYVVLNLPVAAVFSPRAMIHRSVTAAEFTIDMQAPSRESIVLALRSVNTRVAAVATANGARIIDPLPALCPDVKCPAVDEYGEPIYRDIWHLRPSYVRNNVRFLDAIMLAAVDSSP